VMVHGEAVSFCSLGPFASPLDYPSLLAVDGRGAVGHCRGVVAEALDGSPPFLFLPSTGGWSG